MITNSERLARLRAQIARDRERALTWRATRTSEDDLRFADDFLASLTFNGDQLDGLEAQMRQERDNSEKKGATSNYIAGVRARLELIRWSWRSRLMFTAAVVIFSIGVANWTAAHASTRPAPKPRASYTVRCHTTERAHRYAETCTLNGTVTGPAHAFLNITGNVADVMLSFTGPTGHMGPTPACLPAGDYNADVAARQTVHVSDTVSAAGSRVQPRLVLTLTASPVTRDPVSSCP